MCMNCVSQSLPYVALALGGLQLPRLRGLVGATSRDHEDSDREDSDREDPDREVQGSGEAVDPGTGQPSPMTPAG